MRVDLGYEIGANHIILDHNILLKPAVEIFIQKNENVNNTIYNIQYIDLQIFVYKRIVLKLYIPSIQLRSTYTTIETLV